MAKIRRQLGQQIKNKIVQNKKRFLKKNSKIANNGTPKKFQNGRVQDARQKIIQKSKKKVVDARDILAKKAQTQDARSRINKLREKATGVPTINGNVKAIGSNIIRKTDRNGKISLVTKDKSKASMEMKVAIQKQLGLIAPPRKNVVKRAPALEISRGIPVRQRKAVPILTPYLYEPVYEPSLFKWTNPAASHIIHAASRREVLGDNWENFSVSRSLRPTSTTYIDLDSTEDEEMPLVSSIRPKISLQGTSRTSNIHSRLEAVNSEPETHGILAQPKTKVVLPAGHRIVVSNLQNTVSQEDIKELFEDIGDLLAARLVRPGVAEVIYKNLKDAQNAVDTYHNRQLDGQPMKCLLVNKRPLNNPTAPALPKAEISRIQPSHQSNKLIPDISTIHKALFQRN